MGRRIACIVFVSGCLALGSGAVAAPPDSRVIRVSKNEAAQQTGIHYNTIQGAIDSLDGAPVTEPVVILVSPGEYPEEVILDQANTSIVGAIRGSVVVNPSSGVPLVIDTSHTSEFEVVVDSLVLLAASSSPALRIDAITADTFTVSDCEIISTETAAIVNDGTTGVSITGSVLRGKDAVLDSNVGGSDQVLSLENSLVVLTPHATSNSYAFSFSSGGFALANVRIASSGSTTGAIRGFDVSGSGSRLLKTVSFDSAYSSAFDAGDAANLARCAAESTSFSWGSAVRFLDFEGAGDDSVQIGLSASSSGTSGVAMGHSSTASGSSSVALGKSASATASNAAALGTSASAGHSNSVAIGASASTTAADQVRLGTSSQTVSIPGPLQAANGATVAGAVSATGSVTGSNIKSGSNFNEAYGSYNFTALTTGTANTAVGNHSLNAVTTGSSNTAVGRLSQQYMTTGVYNTSVGYDSLKNATIATVSTGIGSFAGDDLVSGWGNTIIGGASDFGSSTPTRRTVVGHWAVGTADYQVTLGTPSDEVHVPGKLRSTGEARLQGGVSFDNMTAPTGVTRAGLYANGGELYAYDSAGNSTQLSSHKNPKAIASQAATSFDDPSVELPFSVHHRNQYIGKGAVVDITKALKWIEEQMLADLGEEGRITFVYDLPAAEVASIENYEVDQIEAAIESAPWIEVSLGANGELPSEAWEEVAETVWTVVDEPTTVHEIDWTTGRVVTVEKVQPVEREQPTGRTVRRLKEGWRLDDGGNLLRKPTVDDVLGSPARSAGPARSAAAPSGPAIEPLPDWVLDRVSAN